MLYSLPAVARSAPPIRLIEQTVSICPLTWLRHAAVQITTLSSSRGQWVQPSGVEGKDWASFEQAKSGLRKRVGCPLFHNISSRYEGSRVEFSFFCWLRSSAQFGNALRRVIRPLFCQSPYNSTKIYLENTVCLRQSLLKVCQFVRYFR